MAPIHTACKKGDLAGVQAAMSLGADLNQKDSGGNAPLVWATYSGNAQAVELLLRHGADPLVRYKAGWSMLHICAKEDLLPVAEVLLRFGGDVTARNDSGRTPAELAKGQLKELLDLTLAAEEAARQAATQKRAAEEAALRQAEAALARSALADGGPRGQAGQVVGGVQPVHGSAGVLTAGGHDALTVAAKRKAAQEADARAREALEEADLLRTVGDAGANGEARSMPAPNDLAVLQSRMASQLRAAQSQLAVARVGVPAAEVTQRAALPNAYGIPSLMAQSTAPSQPLAAPPPAASGPPHVRVTGWSTGQQAASAGRQPDSPSTPASARRALLSPDELRARAAAAASAAPVQTHQLNHLRKAAEEAVQQQKLQQQQQQQQQQQRSKRDSKASSVAQQPLAAVRAAAASARTTPAPASGEAAMSQQAPASHTERSTTGDPRVGDTDMTPAVALKELRLDALDGGEVPGADPDYTPPPPSAPAPASALSSFLAFLFGEDEDTGGGDVAKARSRMCCVLPIGGMPVVEHEPSMQKVPSLLLDEDR